MNIFMKADTNDINTVLNQLLCINANNFKYLKTVFTSSLSVNRIPLS